MSTKVIIAGAAGRMGQELIRCAKDIKELEVTAAIEAADHKDLGKDAGTVAGIDPIGIKITSDLRSALDEADVVIDFTFHTVVPLNAAITAEKRRAMVIGTTGLDEVEHMAVCKEADKIPILWAPNMSVGVNLLFAMVEKAASVLGMDYKVEVDETHHIHKKDAPSGTALRLGERVADGYKKDFKSIMIFDEQGTLKEHPAGKIVMHSHRKGEVVGDHTVSFENQVERIEFTHHAWSRAALAMGALQAAQWIVSRKPAIYDMQDMLGLRQSSII